MYRGRISAAASRAVAAAALLGLAAGVGLSCALGGHATTASSEVGTIPPPSVVDAAVQPSAAAVPLPPSKAPATGLGPFRRAWVSVPVATVWNHPHTARPVDSPAVSSAPDVRRWATTMAYRQKLGLDDLLATQALLDQPLFVYGHDGDWVHVLVLGQTGSVYPWGIAGWIPTGQITYTAPPAGLARATVDVPSLVAGGLDLSYGTELPVASSSAGKMTVVLPAGSVQVPDSAMRTGPLSRSGPAVVAQAERFLGLPYLWAGTSSFGYDCSGLTYSVYRRFGITLARDAGDQARGGTAVAKNQLEPGDLVFFAFDGKTVDHVGIYAGHGMMVDSPRTGAAIELVPLWSAGLSPYFAGARRYV